MGTKIPSLFNSSIKLTRCNSKTKNGLLSISALTLYTTAAKCLQGTAQSGHEHCILKSVHCFGKTFNPKFSAIVNTSGSSSLFRSLEINVGFLRSEERRVGKR